MNEEVCLSSELWLNVLYFLDFRDLCSCERINKNFTDLSREDSLWKALCQYNFPLLTEPKDDSLKWKEYYKYILGLDVSGKHSLYSTSVDISEENNWPLYQKVVSIEKKTQIEGSSELINQVATEHRKYLPSYSHATHPIVGSGRAPWGKFQIIGCKYGNHFAFLHIYEGHGYFTNYHVELKEGVFRGNWKTNWQELTGLCIYGTSPQVDDNVRDKFIKFDHDFSTSNTIDADKLLGEWDLWFFTEYENKETTTTNFHISLNETSCHALRGSVQRSFVRDSLVIGCLQDSAISLSIVTAPIENATTYKFYSLIGKISQDMSFINGRVVVEENDKIYCGLFYGTKKKENVHKKSKHN